MTREVTSFDARSEEPQKEIEYPHKCGGCWRSRSAARGGLDCGCVGAGRIERVIGITITMPGHHRHDG